MPRHAVPPSAAQQRSLALKAYRAALARALAEKKERERRAVMLASRLADERRRLKKATTAIATLRWGIEALDGSAEIAPSPDRRRVTPLPRGAMTEGAMDIMRASAGRWLSPEEIAREVLASFGVRRPSDDMIEAGSASVASVLRRFGAAGLAEHDGGRHPRRWRLRGSD